jgi:hypothetical protein
MSSIDLMYQKKKILNDIYEQVLMGENFMLFFVTVINLIHQ